MSFFEVPHWLRLACRRWGSQKRRVILGHVARPGYITHVDGYPAQSVLARIRDERDGAGQGAVATQRWLEVYTGDGLDVQRAIQGMPEHPLLVFNIQYVPDPEWEIRVSERARSCEVSRPSYFQLLALAEVWVLSRLDPSISLDAQPAESAASLFTDRRISATSPPQVKHDAEVSLTALQRPMLRLTTKRVKLPA